MAVIRNITEDTLSVFRADAPPVFPGAEITVPDEVFVERAWPTSTWEIVEPPALDGYAEANVEDAHLWAEPDPTAYDPADHKVDEVVDYLAAADDAERERVIQAEAAGKARTTITEWSE